MKYFYKAFRVIKMENKIDLIYLALLFLFFSIYIAPVLCYTLRFMKNTMNILLMVLFCIKDSHVRQDLIRCAFFSSAQLHFDELLSYSINM